VVHWRLFIKSWPVAASLVLAGCTTVAPGAGPAVRDDPVLQIALEDARSGFLAGRHFDRLDVTILLAAGDGSWRRASVGGHVSWYPASCVKLAFAIAAVRWCEDAGRSADCLDKSVLSMLRDSDNVATGVVVDTITGTENGPLEGADYATWFARRLYTERLLDRHGLLDGQRFFNKTYPTNSGEMPEGLEAVARERHGRNAMHAEGGARLMLALVTGEFGAAARDYIRSRLRRPPVSAHSSMGGGFPDGTLYESKIGDAYDTLAEIVHAELPDGRRIIISAFSNARDPDGPDEQDLTALADFSKRLIERLPADD
jgi:Beta-lactamase enzyme family